MNVRNVSVMRYISGALGLFSILALIVWGFSKAPSFVGDPTARVCLNCEQNGCPATAASWRELFEKYWRQ